MIASAGSLSSVGLWRLYRANFVAEFMGAVVLSELTAQFDDRICTITLNRPGQLNCVNDAMMSLFETTLASLEATERLNGVILTAMGGRSFCSGGDLTWLKTLNNPDSGARMGRRMQSILERLSRLACPVICVLNGFALGGGAEIALACDIRIIESHAYLSCKQAQVGLSTGWSGGPRLLNTVGYAVALELLATGRKLSAQETLELGLCTHMAPTGAGLDKARELLSLTSRSAPAALKRTKVLLRRLQQATNQQDAFRLENEAFRELWFGAEHREALRAFADGRRPDFDLD